tara:strand:- start:8164 stop:9018 length:855 start_codon:yes stop_codon:yes gene_type:complete
MTRKKFRLKKINKKRNNTNNNSNNNDNNNVDKIEEVFEPECRICMEGGGDLFSPCICKGSMNWIHRSCLNNQIKHQFEDEYIITPYCRTCRYFYKRKKQNTKKAIFNSLLPFLANFLFISLNIFIAFSFIMFWYKIQQIFFNHQNYYKTISSLTLLNFFLFTIVCADITQDYEQGDYKNPFNKQIFLFLIKCYGVLNIINLVYICCLNLFLNSIEYLSNKIMECEYNSIFNGDSPNNKELVKMISGFICIEMLFVILIPIFLFEHVKTNYRENLELSKEIKNHH